MHRWSCKNPLTIEERRIIKEMTEMGSFSNQIGKELRRAKSTVLRELKRLGKDKEYDPELAQLDFERKQHEGWEKCRQTKKMAYRKII